MHANDSKNCSAAACPNALAPTVYALGSDGASKSRRQTQCRASRKSGEVGRPRCVEMGGMIDMATGVKHGWRLELVFKVAVMHSIKLGNRRC